MKMSLAASVLVFASSAKLLASSGPIALTRVAIVDTRGGATLPEMTVVVTGDRISEVGRVGTVAIPKGASIVEASGKYLIPGLWDMHAHIFTHKGGDAFFALYAVNGVTAVRDMHTVLPMAEIEAYRRRLADGSLIGPRLAAVAGPLITGVPMPFSRESPVTTVAAAREAVIARKRMGVDFIKVHGGLTRETHLAIADEARRQGLPFAGHATGSPGDSSDAGQRSIEHNTEILAACATNADERQKENTETPGQPGVGGVVRTLRRRASASFDELSCQEVFARFRANDTWMVPTLVLGLAWQYLEDGTVPYPGWLRYMPRSITTSWGNALGFRRHTPRDLGDGKNDFKKQIEIVAAMRRAGVKVLAGTDASGPYPSLVPGISLHEELRLFVEAGFTPAEALRTATLDPARFLGRDKDFGTAERGKIADLVLLDADPLADIRNTQKINAVLLNGRLLGRKSLDEVLAGLEKSAAE